jgi:hypothetical protein
MASEPCVVCGEETGLGHAQYLGRREVKGRDGSARFLCAECQARSRPARRHELSDEERRRLDEHAAMFGLAFNATGH